MRFHYGVFCTAIALPGCFPSFEDRPWLVDEERIVAIRGTPAEGRPGERVELDALVVSPAGPVDGPLRWQFCRQPRTSEERTGVTQACMVGEDLQATGTPAAIPSDACSRFGPTPSTSEANAQPSRPSDPDPSGGYFLPIRAQATTSNTAVTAFGFLRIRCDLPAVTRAIFDEYQDRYTLNVNPTVQRFSVDGSSVEPSEEGIVAAKGSTITLRLAASRESSETYVLYDAETSTLLERQERLTVTWFVTDGEVAHSRQELSPLQLSEGTAFENDWQLPSTPQTVYTWAVLQDERGGTDWSSLVVTVE